MTDASYHLRRSILLAVPLLLALASAAGAQSPTPNPTPNPIYSCSGRITGGLRNYSTNYLRLLGDCEVAKLDGDACESNLNQALQNENQDLNSEVANCSPEAQDALCPLESDILSELFAALTGNGAESVKNQLTGLINDIFQTDYPGCTRPTGAVSSNARECGEKIADLIGGGEMTEQVEQCFFSCERARLLTPGLEICVDDFNGEPIKQQVIECQDDKLGELDQLDDFCDASAIEELGCPLGAESLSGLKNALATRLATFVQQLNLEIFHSECQGPLPGEPTEPVPASVTLRPSNTVKQLECGDTVDGAFMGSDKELVFNSDMDCGPSQTATDGIIVNKSKIVISGVVGKKWSIRGPRRSSLRTGVGIKLLPGAARVQIKNFKAIENFGVGIEDAVEANNRKLQIIKSTVRRNVVAGLRIRSPRTIIDQVVADKNGIGMDLSGDGTKVKNGSEAKGSLYAPKVGIQLSGIDNNADGKIVQITSGAAAPNVIELNQGAGIYIVSGPHLVQQAQIRNNVGDGILIGPLGLGSTIDSNTIKFNTRGIVVQGDQNLIDSNLCEENVGDGYVIESVPVEGGGTIGGLGNTLLNNSSGKKTDRGNGDAGYRIGGDMTVVDTNEAEANLGAGFVVTGPTALFKGNSSQENFGSGFDVQSTPNTLETNSAEANNQSEEDDFHEWVFVAGQSDSDGNKAGGDTIQIPATAGFCDNDGDCPVDD